MKQETSAETLRRVLSKYELGRKLRQLRLKKKISLADLGKHTGLSQSMLSQLENDRMFPTLPTLARIAMVFDVSLDYFFGDQRQTKAFAVVRAKERMKFPERADAPRPSYFFECLSFAAQGKGMQAYLAEFSPQPKAGEGHLHDGTEFLFVLEGAVAVRYQGVRHELEAGDSAMFDAAEEHSYQGVGRKAARAIVVTLPPSSQ